MSVSATNSNRIGHSGVAPRCGTLSVLARRFGPALLMLVCGSMLLACAAVRAADDVKIFQAPSAFLEDVFGDTPPSTRKLWLTKRMQKETETILGHPLGVLRVPYWTADGRYAFVLDEIGKDKPITTGVVVKDGQIEQVRILVFRESRGWEVGGASFVEQFDGVGFGKDTKLNRHIDGITGATMSVRAVTRQARLALYLYKHIKE